MAMHSRTIAWKLSWTEEPDRLQSLEMQSRTRLSDFTSLGETGLGLRHFAAVLECLHPTKYKETVGD